MNEVERDQHVERDQRVARVRLDPSETAPSAARRFVGDVLHSDDDVETIKLVVSELVTNAVRHGGPGSGPIFVEIDTAGPIRLEVSQPDQNGLEARVQSPGIDDETGRGLLIVDAVSSNWGVDASTGTVWATFG